MSETPSGLTDAQRDELAAELERQLARLERSMAITDEALRTVELDQTAVGRLSRMDSLQNQNMSKGLRDREVVRLSQIREALERLAAGSYGLCTRCGGIIPFERLFVFPEAPECAACVNGT
ncbi:MAG: TraR/DksA family transcriptional regulator [Acidobacteriota bacterium]|nr:TraR/DksA family transcriptional regulator [Acidobacteriota bacterium]